MILDAGVSPTVLSDGNNYTPLMTASDAGQREIARLFWYLVGPEGRSYPAKPTYLELAAGNGYVDLVSDFLDIWDGWSMDEKCGVLYVAVRYWYDNVVSLLLAKVPYETDAIQTALELSIARGTYKSVLFIPALGCLGSLYAPEIATLLPNDLPIPRSGDKWLTLLVRANSSSRPLGFKATHHNGRG
jgi:hypothetical protein